MKKVLFVASEAVPYVKTGGLADVVGSLPQSYNKEEYDVRVILPKYACMKPEFTPELQFLCHFYVNLSWRKQYAGILTTTYKGITYYFVDNEFYFAGDKPYNNIYEDVEKFAFFDKAVLQALPYLDFWPDIIHCHDWQTGLLPVFLHASFCSDPAYTGIKTVYSIHNLAFQGRWRIQEVMDITGLPESIFTSAGLEAYGEANYLKGGVVYADAVTTVSPSYADDIRSPEGGYGLDGLMQAKGDRLQGILNGLDYDEYNPKTDELIAYKFGPEDMVKGKLVNKHKLQEESGLPVSDQVFLIGMVSRMTDQKGFDLVDYMTEEILSTMNVQMVVLGTGEDKYQHSMKYFEEKYKDKLKVTLGYSEKKAHEIYASCDAFLMPSLFEPCGLSQMMAMRYGTVPIVRETGGLKDTVSAFNEYDNVGNGFSFCNYNAHEMLGVIKYAESIFSNRKDAWLGIMERDMKEDHSWRRSAEEYEKLYERLLEN